MAAVGALDGASGIVVGHDDALDFALLSCAQNAPQSGHAATAALRSIQHLADQLLVMTVQGVGQNALGFFPRLVVRHGSDIA